MTLGKRHDSGLRKGFTTGACAAAAAQGAATGAATGTVPQEVQIALPGGKPARFRVTDGRAGRLTGRCAVTKDAGDDPDVTNGMKIVAEVTVVAGSAVSIYAGDGVGTVTKPGLQAAVGEPAINPIPRAMILREVQGALGPQRGARVTISAPGGREVAKKTFNPRLGIVGGISILGTTGIVEPKSAEALKASLLCALDVAKAEGFDTVFLTPGRIGERGVRALKVCHSDQIVQTSNYIGFMMDEALRRGFKQIILAGHPGKLAKLIAGHFMTHHSESPAACAAVISIAAASGLSEGALREAEDSTTVEGIIDVMRRAGRLDILDVLSARIRETAERRVQRAADVRVILFDMRGARVGES